MKNLIFTLIIAVFLLTNLMAQKMNILINHEGYETKGPKKAVVQGVESDKLLTGVIKSSIDASEVMSISPKKVGKIDQWKNWFFWELDFSSLQKEGEYYLECETSKGSVRSFPFKIQENIMERHFISDVLFYFRGQRCVGLFQKADREMKFLNDEKRSIDASGGWQDASGDYGKHLSHLSFSTYFNPQQIPLVVYTLAKSFEMLDARETIDFNQIKRRLIDEILYGADYLVKMKKEDGSFYRSVSGRGPGKLPEDRRITPTMNSFHITKKKKDGIDAIENKPTPDGDTYEVGYRAGAGISIASLAIASQLGVCGDFSSETYLKNAEEAFAFLAENNIYYTNDGEENIVDDYCALAAATELYKATKKDIYKKAADKRANNLMNRLCSWKDYNNYWAADNNDRPFFHAADAGYPIVVLSYYLDICEPLLKEKVLSEIKKSLEHELAVTAEVPNVFGYARQLVQNKSGDRYTSFFFPHDTETAPWWQGENARIASMASAARIAGKHFHDDTDFQKKLDEYATNQLNWVVGLNPYDVSMLHGTGRNNPEYMFFGSYQYTSAPGGICNGITGGLENRHDIDFNVPYSVTGKDFDWRWAEQWLPHTSWFIIAVSAGNILN